MAATKPQFSPHYTPDIDSHDVYRRKNTHQTRTVESLRLGLTILSLLLGITIISTTADVLAVFQRSHISADYMLPLWPPINFDIGPTIAIIVGGAVAAVSGALALLGSKVSAISSRTTFSATLTFLAPTTSLLAAIIGTAYFYGVNASRSVDTLQSWSCRWRNVVMQAEPHFDRLCGLSRAGLYAEIVLIPVQVLVLGLAGVSVVLRRGAERGVGRDEVELEERKG